MPAIPSLTLAKSFCGDLHSCRGMLLTEKLDGMRAYWDGAALLSRNGNEIMAPQAFLAVLPRGFELDGELWAGRGKFQRCMSVARSRRRDAAEWEEIRYVVFDTPGAEPYAERMLRVRAALAEAPPETVQVLPWTVCEGDEHLAQEMRRVVRMGGEGLMLRTPSAPYTAGRTSFLLKVKQAEDAEATVAGYVPGKGKLHGLVGALLCIDRGSGQTFRIGTGLTEQERAHPPAIGAEITYKFSERTAGGAPRFPVFVRERPLE